MRPNLTLFFERINTPELGSPPRYLHGYNRIIGPVRLRQLCRQRSSRRRQERTGSAPAACSGTAPPRCGAGAGGGAVAAAKGGNSEGGGQVEGG